MDGDLGGFFRQALAHADVERNAAPAPCINKQAHGDVGFGFRGGGNAVFLAVSGNGVSIHMAGCVLGADHVRGNLFRRVPLPQRADDFHLLIADAVGGKVGGWLHRDEAEELEEVVLHHVAQSSGLLIIASTPTLHAEVFRAGDLDVADVAAVPERLENRVGETQHHQILGGFLTEVVVDAVGVLFREGLVDDLIEVLGGFEIGAEGFLDDYARPAAVLGLVEAGAFELEQDFVEKLGGGCDVEQAIALAAAAGVNLVEAFSKGGVSCDIVELRLVVADAVDEILPNLRVVAAAGNLFVELFKSGAELGVGFFAAGEADDVDTGGQLAIDGEVVERGDELAVSQVSSGSEDHHGAWLGPVTGNEIFSERIRHSSAASFNGCLHKATRKRV